MSQDIRNSLRPGMVVVVHQKIKEINAKGQEKERIQLFEGIVLAVKHGKEAGATVTVRKISNGVGVEKIFPISSPLVDKIELVREMKVQRSKVYYLRTYKKKLKEKRGEKFVKVEIEHPVEIQNAEEEKKEPEAVEEKQEKSE